MGEKILLPKQKLQDSVLIAPLPQTTPPCQGGYEHLGAHEQSDCKVIMSTSHIRSSHISLLVLFLFVLVSGVSDIMIFFCDQHKHMGVNIAIGMKLE